MKNIILAFILFTVLGFDANSQNMKVIDSLITLSKTVNDTTKANLYNQIAAQWSGADPEKNKEYGYKIIELGKKSGYEKYVALGNFKLGIYYYTIGQNDSSNYFYQLALDLAKKNKRVLLEGYIHQNLAFIYEREGKYDKAIQEILTAVSIQEKAKNVLNVANLKNNIGVIYIKQNDYASAEKYILESFESLKKAAVPGTLGYVYENMGLIERNKGNFKKAGDNYLLALAEFKLNGDLSNESGVYQNMGMNFLDLGQADSSEIYNAKVIQLGRELNNLTALFSGYVNHANIYLRFLPNPKKVLAYLDSASKITELFTLPEYRIGYIQIQAEYELTYGEKSSGFLLMDKFLNLKDSLLSVENLEIIKNVNAKYETEKKDLQIKNQSLEIDAKQKENDAKNKILLLGAIGLLAVLIFAFIAYSNFRKTQKANIIINSQKQQVELQKEEISNQKILVEEKQKEIIDSINYAQKIQSAVLTGEQVWKKITPEYFILFQPKDIVSGDFYWAYNTVNSRSVIALADCTGHGVPGGFMSMLGNSFLNELVVENKIFKPDEILNKLRQKIIASLGQKGGSTDRRDGMDMAICTWNKVNNTLEFAGANNKLWLIRNGTLIEYAGDKMPVGNYAGELNPYTCHTIELHKNDLIVLSTDGFADQFGGSSGKKLMSKNLKAFLVNLSDLPMDMQKDELNTFFNEWKGKHEQVDDISLIALKVV